MSAHNAKLTVENVLRFLADNAGMGYLGGDIAAEFDASPNAGMNMARRLHADGLVKMTPGPRSSKIYHVGELVNRPKAPVDVTAPKHVGEVTPPFRTTCWTPPLRGYEAGLRAAASLAMAGRA